MDRTAPPEYVEALRKRGFSLAEWLGGGAYGNVYKAEQSSLHRPVAVKFFDNRLAQSDANRQRFSREAPLLARVQHPCVPYVITTGTAPMPSGAVPFTVMQFVSGPSLAKRLSTREPMNPASILQVMRSLLSALDCVHRNDVVHRDVKPDNVMLAEHGTYLIDFSIGVCLSPQPGLARATKIGERVGTADYAAPEQFEDSSEVTSRVDIYSAGVLLAEMLGARPRLRLERLDNELSDTPSAIRNVIRRAAAENPSDRFERAVDFLVALEGAYGHSLAPAPNTTAMIDDALTDDDALVLGVVSALCPVPGETTVFSNIEHKLEGILSRFRMVVSTKRLTRTSMLETVRDTDWNGNEYAAIKLTDKGELWVDSQHTRISALLDMVEPGGSRGSTPF